jgi:molecular chaperone DnaJ
MAKRDYYEILGIDRGVNEAEIKKTYRNLAMQYHPDRNPGDNQAAEKMIEVNEAYAVLSDSKKRRLYNTYGHAGLEGYSQEDIFRGVDFSSLFHEFGLGDIFGFDDSLFGGLFGRRTTSRRGPRKGADLRYDLSLTLEDVAFGTEKTIELPRAEKCTSCNGTGAEPGGLEQCESCDGTGQIIREQRSGYSVFRQIMVCGKCGGRGKIVKEACKICEGKGVIRETEEIDVTVPAGTDMGHGLRIDGKGEQSEDLPGDLYVVLHVEKHPVFERHDDDLYVQEDITFTTAALGGEVKVRSLDGDIKLDIPEGTQTGSVFRIEGHGIGHLDGSGWGDEYIIVRVVTPTDLTGQEKDLLRKLEKLNQKTGDKKHEQDDKR